MYVMKSLARERRLSYDSKFIISISCVQAIQVNKTHMLKDNEKYKNVIKFNDTSGY